MQQCRLCPFINADDRFGIWKYNLNCYSKLIWINVFCPLIRFPNSHRIKFIIISGVSSTVRSTFDHSYFLTVIPVTFVSGVIIRTCSIVSNRLQNWKRAANLWWRWSLFFFCTGGPSGQQYQMTAAKKADSYAKSVHITWVLHVYTHSHAPKYITLSNLPTNRITSEWPQISITYVFGVVLCFFYSLLGVHFICNAFFSCHIRLLLHKNAKNISNE